MVLKGDGGRVGEGGQLLFHWRALSILKDQGAEGARQTCRWMVVSRFLVGFSLVDVITDFGRRRLKGASLLWIGG